MIDILIFASSKQNKNVEILKNYISNFLAQDNLSNYRCLSWKDHFSDQAACKDENIWKILFDKATSLYQSNGYAIILMTFDDQAIIDNHYYRVPRSNTLVEYILCKCILKNDHLYCYIDRTDYPDTPLKLPSDLSGLYPQPISMNDASLKDVARVIVGYIRRGNAAASPAIAPVSPQNPLKPEKRDLNDYIKNANV